MRTSDLPPPTRAYLCPVGTAYMGCLYSYIQGLEIDSVKMLSPFHFRIVYNLTDQLLFNHSFAIWGKSSLEMPLADVQKFGSGVQIQIACSAMSVVARYESISLSDAALFEYLLYFYDGCLWRCLPCAAAVPLWPDLDSVFVAFGETGRCNSSQAMSLTRAFRQKKIKLGTGKTN